MYQGDACTLTSYGYLRKHFLRSGASARTKMDAAMTMRLPRGLSQSCTSGQWPTPLPACTVEVRKVNALFHGCGLYLEPAKISDVIFSGLCL